MENRYKINYDIKQRCITNVKFKQGDVDSSVLELMLYDNGQIIDITGESIEFRFLKPDNTVVFQDNATGVKILDGVSGKVECILKSNTLAAVGVVKTEIFRSKDGKKLTTPSFYFTVEESIGEGGTLSSNYISAIEGKILEWENIFKKNESSRQSTFETNESNRQNTFDANETVRKTDFEQIKRDYDSYKNVMIAESNVAELQSQINENKSQLADIVQQELPLKANKLDLNTEVTNRTNAIYAEKSERQAEIAIERARINSFTALGAGSTTGDAELIDARVGADGITYPNAGGAIRGQLNNFKSVLTQYSVSPNLIGTDANTLYRCYIPKDTQITVSTSDSTTITKAITFNLYRKDKTRADYWSLQNFSKRTITTNDDIYYLALTDVWSAPIQVEIGTVATSYKPYFMNSRVLSDVVENLYTDDKIKALSSRAKVYNGIETQVVNGYLSNTTGQITDTTGNMRTEISDYIYVTKGEKFNYSGLCSTSVAGVAFFDKNLNFLSSVNDTTGNSPVIKEITVPSGATFARFASYHNDAIICKLIVTPVNDEMYVNGLTGKKWYACGDSFTEGAYIFDGINLTDKYLTSGKYANKLKNYPHYIGNRTNCNVYNIALSGSTLAKVTSDDYSFTYEKYKTIPSDTDYITLWFGINDSAQGVPIGSIDDTINTTFIGAWNVALKYLLENCPKAHIGIIVSNNLSRAFVDATIACAKKWGIPFLDLNSDKVPMMQATLAEASAEAKQIAINKFALSATNMHPNYFAHEFESRFIENWLLSI